MTLHAGGWGNQGTGGLAGVRPEDVVSTHRIQHALVMTSHPPTKNPHFFKGKINKGGRFEGEKDYFTHINTRILKWKFQMVTLTP